jgi:hypothetical protein
LGSAWHTCKAGDQVFLLEGLSVPIVLIRQDGGGRDLGKYRVVTPAVVADLMQGQVWDKCGSIGDILETVVIVSLSIYRHAHSAPRFGGFINPTRRRLIAPHIVYRDCGYWYSRSISLQHCTRPQILRDSSLQHKSGRHIWTASHHTDAANLFFFSERKYCIEYTAVNINSF